MSYPYVAKAYYSERHRIAGHYVAFTDGVGYIHSSGYKVEVALDNFALPLSQIRKSVRDPRWLQYLPNIVKMAGSIKDVSDYQPMYNSLLNSFRRFELYGPFASDAHKKFRFARHAKPNGLQFFPSKSSKADRFMGVVYINPSQNLPDSIRLDSVDFYFEPYCKLIRVGMVIHYRQKGGELFPQRLEARINIDNISSTITLNFLSIPYRIGRVGSKEYFHLFNYDRNPVVRYSKAEWEKWGIDSDLGAISKTLGAVIPLEQQFAVNNGKTYLSLIILDGTTDTEPFDHLPYIEQYLNEFESIKF